MCHTPSSSLWTLFFAVVVVAVLPHVPVASLLVRPLLWLSTLAHEGGHGLTGLVVGAGFERLEIWPDGSGMAHFTRGVSPHRSAAISLGGLIGPALTSTVLFLAGTSRRLSRLTLALSGLIAVVTAVTVAAGFGLVIAAGSAVVLFALSAWLRGEGARLAVLVLATDLAVSVFSRADYLFTAVAKTGGGEAPSDVAQIAEQFGGSYLLWGAGIAVLSTLLLVFGVAAFFGAAAGQTRWAASRQRRQTVTSQP